MSAEVYLQRMFEFVRKAGVIALEYRQDSVPTLKPDRRL